MVKTFDVPVVGSVDRRILFAVAAVGAGYVGWSWWRARGDAGAADAAGGVDAAASDFTDGGGLPAVLGAVSPTNSYGLPDPSAATTPDSSSYGFTGTTNSQWAQYAASQLSVSERWSPTDILTALGNYLSNAPLTQLQRDIIQAALALAGREPQGQHVIVAGGETPITVAPRITSVEVTATTATVHGSAVPGAASYRVYRSGVSAAVGTAASPDVPVGGLDPGRSYTFTLRAVTGSGKVGPASAPKTAKTKGVVLATPRTPSVSKVTGTTALVSTGAVSGADGYNWYINGVAHGHSDAPRYTVSALHRKTKYRVSVAADTRSGAPGKQSPARSFKTK